MSDIQVGDLVLPEEWREYEEPLKRAQLVGRVTHVYKNGNLRAKTPNGERIDTGPVESFYKVEET